MSGTAGTGNIMRKSFRKRVILWVGLVISVAIALTVILTFFFVRQHMSAQMHTLLENKVLSVQGHIEQRIRYLVENTVLLTKNDFVINAFVDPGGREGYLLPLTENFMEGKAVVSLNLVDFDGKVLFKTQENIPTYDSSKELRTALAMQQETLYLDSEKWQFTVVAPIRYYGTSQGAVVVVFDLSDIARQNRLADPQAYFALVHDTEKRVFYYDSQLKYMTATIHPTAATPYLNVLKLDILAGLAEEKYFAPVKEALVRLSLIGILAVAAGLIVALLLAGGITKPIMTLFERVRHLGDGNGARCYPIGTDDELDALAKVFDERSDKLQDVSAELSRLNHELEKRVEDEVGRRQKSEMMMLNQSRTAAMGEMISAVSHHWRQPLNLIGLEVQSLRDDFDDGLLDRERLDGVIEVTMNKLTEMSNTIDNLRGMADVKERRYVSVHTEISSVYQLLKAEFDQRHIKVECLCGGPEAHPFDRCVCELSDTNRIGLIPSDFRQVIFNIFVNARDAIAVSPNHANGHVTVNYELEGSRWFRISIEDNGGGIDESIMNQVFDPFFTTKERGVGHGAISGVGLGLYQAKMAVEEHMNGEIRMENGPEGARVILRLPVMEGL